MIDRNTDSKEFLEKCTAEIWSTPRLKNHVQKQIILYEALLETIRDRLDRMRSAVDHQNDEDAKRHVISDRIFNIQDIRDEIRESIGRNLPRDIDDAIIAYEAATINNGIDQSIDRLEESLTHLSGRSIRATTLASQRTYFGGPDEDIVDEFVKTLGEDYGQITAEAFGWHRETSSERPFVIVEDSNVDQSMPKLDDIIEQFYTPEDKFEIYYPDEFH